MVANIAVYAGWLGLTTPLRLGWLHARRGAGREVFEFEFDAAALAHPATRDLHLEPRLGLFAGRQHPPQGHETFGIFVDASPDRWGRLLMRRRLERAQRAGLAGKAVRNHGFILVPGQGWRLSEAYDMNPVPDSQGLKLNVSEADNAMEIDLARSVAPYFRVSKPLADDIIKRSQSVVKQWPKIASSLKIAAREQERMAAAFRLAG